MGIATFFGGEIKEILIFSIPVAIGFYFYGFAFIDYINERRRLNIQQSIYFVSKHKGLAIAIGSIYSVFFLSFFYIFRMYEKLPSDTATQLFWGTVLVISFILAAIAPILAITSATLSMHQVVNLEQNEYAIKSNLIQPKNEDSSILPKTEVEESENEETNTEGAESIDP
jgi:CysZ protein